MHKKLLSSESDIRLSGMGKLLKLFLTFFPICKVRVIKTSLYNKITILDPEKDENQFYFCNIYQQPQREK